MPYIVTIHNTMARLFVSENKHAYTNELDEALVFEDTASASAEADPIAGERVVTYDEAVILYALEV